MNKKVKLFIGIIIGIIVSIGGVYATGQLTANEIEIDKASGKLANVRGTKVKDALDYLYAQAAKIGQCPYGYTCSIITNPGYLPANDSNTYTQSTFVQNLKVGDLIKMIPSGPSFQTDGSKTGDLPRQINPQELQYWRVISRNDNGTIDVVSEYVSSYVYFMGTAGYTNLVGYLNELASHYENPAYTIGSRYIGYSGQTEYIQDPSAFNGTRDSAPWTLSTSSSTTAANEELGSGDMGYETDCNFVKEAYKGTTIYGSNSSGTLMAYKVGTTTANEYWLASRNYLYNTSSFFTFYGRSVDTSGTLNNWNKIRSRDSDRWNNISSGFALRPILTLKADITSSGTEASTGAYILG